MKKIISLFCRNYDGDRQVRDEIVPGAEWVVAGEGVATRKWDGTCCLIRNGRLFKRYDRKPGKKAKKQHMDGEPWCATSFKQAPKEWEAAEDQPDLLSGHWPGWVPVGNKAEDAWHNEAILNTFPLPDGTYELCGPKIGGNPERMPHHVLIRHGVDVWDDAPRDFDGLRRLFQSNDIEGLVWHHPDGRMVKIKARDFGLKWPRLRWKTEVPE